VQEAAAAMEAAHVTAVLSTTTSTQEAAVLRDGITVCFKDAEDRATLAERDTWERVLRAMALASTREQTEGLV
jgi:hypothetical protein